MTNYSQTQYLFAYFEAQKRVGDDGRAFPMYG